MDISGQKLLIANRGEIALRIIRTARKLGLYTIAIYTPADATAPHVSLADEAIPLAENLSYLDADEIVGVARMTGATLVHPGYGFLSENAEFASKLRDTGVTFLGPSAEVIHKMGLKHEARGIAQRAGVPVVPGSEGLLTDVVDALKAAETIRWPVMLKSTAGGGGMGLVICNNEKELKEKFESTQNRAKVTE
jgi:urea carboxylase